MLTARQHELLFFLKDYSGGAEISPSFEEMKAALGLHSKAGVHRLLTGLEERGFIRRLRNRSRAIEIIKLPESRERPTRSARKAVRTDSGFVPPAANENDAVAVPVMGKIAAGSPISAIQSNTHWVPASKAMLGTGDHFALEVHGDSMIEAGIMNGDTVLVRRQDSAESGDIVVALVDNEEATLKRFRRQGRNVRLEAANPAYEDRVFPSDRVQVQGRLVGLLRQF